MTLPPIRQFIPEQHSGQGQYPTQEDVLVPYFKCMLGLVNQFLIAAGQTPKLRTGRDLALNSEWGYLAPNGVHVIEFQTDFFPAYCYSPLGQCSPLAFASIKPEAFEEAIQRLGFRAMDKIYGQGGNLYYWVDKDENPDPNAQPEFVTREQVDYPSLVSRWNKVRQGLSS